MNKKEIFKILIKEFHNKKLPQVISRDIHIDDIINSNKIVVFSGVKGSGKTFILFQIIKKLLKNKIPKKNIIYINFDDIRIKAEMGNKLKNLLKAYIETYPDIDIRKTFFFLDEIQNIKPWKKAIKKIYDDYTQNIFLTATNLTSLLKDIPHSIKTKYFIDYEIYPLSFKEFLKFKKISLKNVSVEKKRAKIKKIFEEYFIYGGFPKVVKANSSSKIDLLQDYIDKILLKDIIEQHKIKNVKILKIFLYKLLTLIGDKVSINKIYNTFRQKHNLKLDKNILYSYLDYFVSTNLIKILTHYGSLGKKRNFSKEKIYFIDNGIINSLQLIPIDSNILLENIVYKELLQFYRPYEKQIYFIKDGNNICDFIVLSNKKKIPIQVCYSLEGYKSENLKKEKIKGLIYTCKKLGVKKGFILTFDEKDDIEQDNIKISILPVFQFLLKLNKIII